MRRGLLGALPDRPDRTVFLSVWFNMLIVKVNGAAVRDDRAAGDAIHRASDDVTFVVHRTVALAPQRPSLTAEPRQQSQKAQRKSLALAAQAMDRRASKASLAV